jgi:hypothetical protein
VRVGGRLVAPAVLALLVVATGCEAPLAPKSKSGDPAASATTSASPSRGASPTDTAASSSPAPLATVSPPPKVKIPPLSPLAKVTGPLTGQDVSWPQCPPGMGIPEKRSAGLPMPETTAQFMVIGLTNGPGFVANPCVADQVAFARERKLLTAAYSVISGPTRFSPRGLTGEQLGYQQARFNIATMKRVGLVTPIVWLDVESVPKFDWGSDKQANAAVIRGAAKGYTDAGYAVGVYSTPYLYASVAGALRMNVPEWRAAGQTSRAEALSRCGSDWVIQGGRGVLGQWVDSGRDRNTTCPGATAQLGRWFHQY